MSKVDLVGRVFSNLYVVGFDHKNEVSNLNFWKCRCDCGNTIVVRGSLLRNGAVKNCGCGITKTETGSVSGVIKVGQKVRFIPAFLHAVNYTPEERREVTATGKIVSINSEHRHFLVEFECGGVKERESFNFCDVGQAVKVCG